ncbi:MAG: hypothetical protein FJ118_18005 [Deltaproteobacteria bacterium]|nr:hypothetical protein [Deltaproteobacteria bacterium]
MSATHEKPVPIWMTGANGQKVFIGHSEVWAFILLVGLDNGWEPLEEESCVHHRYLQTLGGNDALNLARVMQKRIVEDKHGPNARTVRLLKAIAALLMTGPVTVAPGPPPKDEDFFLLEPKRPPHLRTVK